MHAPTYKPLLYVRDVHLISPTLIHATLFKTLLYVRGLHLNIPTLIYAIKIYTILNRGFWVAGSWSRTNTKKQECLISVSLLKRDKEAGRHVDRPVLQCGNVSAYIRNVKVHKKNNKQKHITRANHTSVDLTDKNIVFRPACQRVKPIKKASFHLPYQPQSGESKPVLLTSQTCGAIS